MTKLTIDLVPDQVDSIIIQEMKWHYENNMKEAEHLIEKLMDNTIEPYEKEDLEDCKKTIDATRYIIEFYSIKEDAEAYFDSFKKYEDVNEHG
jgi:hypothetical protein